MKTPKTTEVIQHFIEELKTPYKPLTSWENGFITSLEDQFSRRGTISDKQFEILERVYAEKTE